VKGADGFRRRRGKRKMKARTGRRHDRWVRLDGELVATSGQTVPDRLARFAGPKVFPDANIAKRAEHGVVEPCRAFHVRRAERYVMEHGLHGHAS
jgi:hypothetical protein